MLSDGALLSWDSPSFQCNVCCDAIFYSPPLANSICETVTYGAYKMQRRHTFENIDVNLASPPIAKQRLKNTCYADVFKK